MNRLTAAWLHRLVLCPLLLAAVPSRGLRLGGDHPEAEADADPRLFFHEVHVLDTDLFASNASEIVPWLRELGTARVAPEFRPSLQITSEGWRLAIPMSPREGEEGRRDVGLPKFSRGEGMAEGCPTFPHHINNLRMRVTPRGHLCMAGRGFQTRAASTMAMFQEAADLLRKTGRTPVPFKQTKIVCIADSCPAHVDFGYTCNSGGACRPIPDFTFWKWPEAGILPNFQAVSERMEQIGREPAMKSVCGWAGNDKTHGTVWGGFSKATEDHAQYDVFIPSSNTGTEGRLSMEEQTRRWACMIDIPCGGGYSGRVPLLLHSGRPLLIAERASRTDESERFTDFTFYGHWLRPNVHFIPVSADFSDLSRARELALSPKGQEIGQNALTLAREKLTTKAAIEFLADVLAPIQA